MSRRNSSSRAGLSLHALSAALSLALAGTSIVADASVVPASNRQVQHRGQSASPDFSLTAQRIAATFARGARSTTSNVPSRAPATRAIHSLADQGSGSLRETLATAVDGDVIDLSGLKGTIKLSAALQPSASVSIRGPGEASLTLDGGRHGRVITSRHSLTLSGMRIVNGSGESGVDGGPALGGCMYVDGDLNLTHATISGCSLGDATTPTAYGGAIAVAGSAYLKYSTIADSTVTAYSSASGGGLVALSQIGVLTSTISGNTANQVLPPPTAQRAAMPEGGGAPPFSALGGGVMNIGSAPTVLLNSTMTGNSATSAGGGTYTCYYNSLPYTCTHFGQALGGGAMTPSPVVIASTVSGNFVHSNGHAYGGGIYMPLSTTPPPAAVAAPASIVLGSIINGGPSGPYLKYASISDNTATSSDSWAGGGGMVVGNTLTIAASAIDGNHVQSDACCYYSGGGGILAKGGVLTIQASTISGNQVTSSGVSASSWGGGVGVFYSASTALIDSTVSGNQITASQTANGAGIAGASLHLSNSTVAFNTSSGDNGGITVYGNASPSFDSTIVASNTATAAASADVLAINSAVVTGANNLVMANSGATLPDDTLTQDPLLLPLAFNGGPTRTHALAAGSPAIDAGSNLLPLQTDQRGYARVVGANADIGAYEFDNDRIFTNGFDTQLGGS